MVINPIERICLSCHEPFTITAAEINFLQARVDEGVLESVILPKRCYRCRSARRRLKFETPITTMQVDVTLTCVDCGVDFVFGGRDATYFFDHGFDTPKRCRPCRTARRDGRPAISSGPPPEFHTLRRRD
jgi:hypothetical protein